MNEKQEILTQEEISAIVSGSKTPEIGEFLTKMVVDIVFRNIELLK